MSKSAIYIISNSLRKSDDQCSSGSRYGTDYSNYNRNDSDNDKVNGVYRNCCSATSNYARMASSLKSCVIASVACLFTALLLTAAAVVAVWCYDMIAAEKDVSSRPSVVRRLYNRFRTNNSTVVIVNETVFHDSEVNSLLRQYHLQQLTASNTNNSLETWAIHDYEKDMFIVKLRKIPEEFICLLIQNPSNSLLKKADLTEAGVISSMSNSTDIVAVNSSQILFTVSSHPLNDTSEWFGPTEQQFCANSDVYSLHRGLSSTSTSSTLSPAANVSAFKRFKRASHRCFPWYISCRYFNLPNNPYQVYYGCNYNCAWYQ